MASPVALRELVEWLVLADEADVRVDVVPELYEIFIGTVDAIVGDIPLMEITHEHRALRPDVKRVLDFVGALFLLIVLSPILLLAGARHRCSRWAGRSSSPRSAAART